VRIERDARPVSAARISRLARSLLRASTLCAIATVSPGGRAHVNTAYFAFTGALEVVWVSAPRARHSRNVRERSTAAVAVFDSTQRWGRHDRGIQLFGTARELRGRAADDARRLYARRFRDADGLDPAYRYYRLRPARVKLFDEKKLGGATFVSARVSTRGVRWERTERYV
jgi:uncharacterized protein YhbP (UPF0306 family)